MIDHVVYATGDLDGAADRLTELLGVSPTAGGSHPTWGTRNVLVGLGGGAYLEIIGPDPSQPAPMAARPFGIDSIIVGERRDGIVAWCAQPTIPLDEAAVVMARAGCEMSPTYDMSRMTPSGDRLEWRLAMPSWDDLSAGYPFLIDWGSTPHPSAAMTAGVTMTALTVPRPPNWSAVEPVVADPRLLLGQDARFALEFDLEGRRRTITDPGGETGRDTIWS